MDTASARYLPPDAASIAGTGSAGGWLTAIGFAGITLTSLLYALAPPEAGLPVHPFVAASAIKAVLAGAGPLRAASVVGIISDTIAAMGAVLVTAHLAREGRAWAAAGWVGVVLSIVVFTFVDSMAGLALVPLAADPTAPAAFIAAKCIFDALFLAGTIAFGLGSMLFFAAEWKAPRFVSGRLTNAIGFAIGGVALVTSLGCLAGQPIHLAVGASIGAGGVLFTWIGWRLTFK